MSKKFAIICLFNFFIAALMGLALRYTFIGTIKFDYRFLTHAHSHVAMLGWVFLMLYVFIVNYFVPERKPIYTKLFWLTQFSVLGMMLSFPFQGYALFSILFSTLHIFCSYYFVLLIWKNHKTESAVSQKLLKTSLVFMLLSTVGVWCLGPAVSTLGQASAFYQIAIQFFLHFQFNGWFLIAVFALFFHVLKIKPSKEFNLFFLLLVLATVLSLALPVNWFVHENILYWINALGVFLQLLALIAFIKLTRSDLFSFLKNESILTRHMYIFGIFCLVLKSGAQLLSLDSELSEVAYQHRNLVIGFIHLLMLGVISGFLFAFILQSNWVTFNNWLGFGIYSFVLGFFLTEFILLLQGILYYFNYGTIPHYYHYLFIASALLPLGLGNIIFNIVKTKASSTTIRENH